MKKVAVYLIVLSAVMSCVQNAPVLTAKQDLLDNLMEVGHFLTKECTPSLTCDALRSFLPVIYAALN